MALTDKLQKDTNTLSQVFKSRNAAVLFGLGFSSGLPLALTGATLDYWLTEEGISVVSIAIFKMLAISYSLKFLWAPLLDRFQIPFLGRRRGWIFLFQSLLIAGLGIMSIGPTQLGLFAMMVALVAFLSASQDIVSDGYRNDLLSQQDVAMGTAVFLLGYRVAMLVSGAGSLVIAERLDTKQNPENWGMVYGIMAVLMIFGLIATYFAPEPKISSKPPATIAGAFEYPFLAFLRRRGAFLILLFIFIYKLADTLLLTGPFYLQLGFGKDEIAFYTKIVGAVVSIAGIAAGGFMTAKLGIRRSLWLGGAATAIANLSFTLLAIIGKSSLMLLLAIGVDNFCNGLVSAPLTAFLVVLCDKKFSATQFAIFTSISSLAGRLLAGLSGVLVEALGWATFFAATVPAAIPGLIVLYFLPEEATEPKTAEASAGKPCPRCNEPIMEGLSFCDSCGYHANLSKEQEEQLRGPLEETRRWLLITGFIHAATGIVLSILLRDRWKIDQQMIPFIVIHLSVLLLHVGLWAWAKIEPTKAVISGIVIVLIAIASDLYFRMELIGYWAPIRISVLVALFVAFRRSKLAQRSLDGRLP
jgi:PAT family beta-lactamase induction signal transducer AmpG